MEIKSDCTEFAVQGKQTRINNRHWGSSNVSTANDSKIMPKLRRARQEEILDIFLRPVPYVGGNLSLPLYLVTEYEEYKLILQMYK
jgi:hypothetical protein